MCDGRTLYHLLPRLNELKWQQLQFVEWATIIIYVDIEQLQIVVNCKATAFEVLQLNYVFIIIY